MSDEAAALLAVLTDWAKPPADAIDKLPKPTKKENQKGRCNDCGGWHGLPAVHLDYVGHAWVTRALIQADPLWSWEPLAMNEAGEPLVVNAGGHLRMWIRLTVHGKTLPAVGTCPANKPEPEKELIGDALRNGAMRFGVALSLRAKDEWSDLGAQDSDAGGGGAGFPEEAVGTGVAPPASDTGDVDEQRRRIRAAKAQMTAAQKTFLQEWMTGEEIVPATATHAQLDAIEAECARILEAK